MSLQLLPPPVSRRRSRRRLLLWTLPPIAALTLFFVLQAFPHLFAAHRRLPARPVSARPAQAPPALSASGPRPAALPLPAPAPLSVTLSCAQNGRHVRVGLPVMVSAYAAVPPGGSATLAISLTRNSGPQSLLTLAQGTLSSAIWTPALPGRYEFAASAIGARKENAFSRHVVVYADAAPAKPKPSSLPPPSVVPMPVRPLAAVPLPAAVPSRSVRPVPARPRRTAARRAAEIASPAHSRAFHVAAGAFAVRPIAETLAAALRGRGYRAAVRSGPRFHGRPSYAVQTGAFLRAADAQKQLDRLRHDGYPAFLTPPH